MKQLKGTQRETAEARHTPCGDFMPNGSWNPNSGHRGQLYAFIEELCRACRAAPLAITPQVAARRIESSIWGQAFPNREQWKKVDLGVFGWLGAQVGTSAEVAVRDAASFWRREEWPIGLPAGGPPQDQAKFWGGMPSPARVRPLPPDWEQTESSPLWDEADFQERRAKALAQVRTAGALESHQALKDAPRTIFTPVDAPVEPEGK